MVWGEGELSYLGAELEKTGTSRMAKMDEMGLGTLS